MIRALVALATVATCGASASARSLPSMGTSMCRIDLGRGLWRRRGEGTTNTGTGLGPHHALGLSAQRPLLHPVRSVRGHHHQRGFFALCRGDDGIRWGLGFDEEVRLVGDAFVIGEAFEICPRAGAVVLIGAEKCRLVIVGEHHRRSRIRVYGVQQQNASRMFQQRSIVVERYRSTPWIRPTE